MPDDARRLDELLSRAKEADAEVARLASGAEPAGEADPYRSDDEESDTDDDDADTGGAEAGPISGADLRGGSQSG